MAALADELGDFESGHTRFPAHGGGGGEGGKTLDCACRTRPHAKYGIR